LLVDRLLIFLFDLGGGGMVAFSCLMLAATVDSVALPVTLISQAI
jgi:hypothetical protein